MKILGIETSSVVGSLALSFGSEIHSVKWSRQEGARASHSEVVTASLQKLLKDSGARLEDIELIAVSQGPGSFTGLRVGINVAKSLSYCLDVPIARIDSLTVIAHGHPQTHRPLLVMTNAYKNMVFHATFDFSERWEPRSAPAVSRLDKLEKDIKTNILCLGDGYETYQGAMSDTFRNKLCPSDISFNEPQAKSLVERVLSAAEPDPTIDWNALTPLYLRPSAAEEKAMGTQNQ